MNTFIKVLFISAMALFIGYGITTIPDLVTAKILLMYTFLLYLYEGLKR